MLEQRTLWLIRHADASPPVPGQDDFDRPLSPKGEKELARMCQQLADIGARAQWLLASSARRTAQTAAGLAATLDVAQAAIDLQPELFHAAAPALLTAITSAPPDIQQLAIVAHNPGLSELATRLNQGRPISLPTLGCCCFETLEPVADWSGLGTTSFRLQQTLRPGASG